MFITVKNLITMIDSTMTILDTDYKVRDGELENNSGLSEADMDEVIHTVASRLRAQLQKLKSISDNKKLINRYEVAINELIR